MREKAYRLCRDYLHGAWKQISCNELVLKRISGGLSNILYLCSLPASRNPKGGEPKQVLLRLYGQIHGDRVIDVLLTDSVIFTLLSERRLGPKLHGIFPGGRLEEYIPARPLNTCELSDPKNITLIGEKLALVHSMSVPIIKEPRWIWETMSRWMLSIQEDSDQQNTSPQTLLGQILRLNLPAELKWLRKQLTRVGSPVVFCHNDLQEGNILLREFPDNPSQRLEFIDFEYCSYNYRGFDLANHFCEWMYNYKEPAHHPNFTFTQDTYPTTEQQLVFIRAYLAILAQGRGHSSTFENLKEEEENILREIRCFTLASHFLWGLWGLINSKVSNIPFGYLEYSVCRFDSYFSHKAQLISDNEFSAEQVKNAQSTIKRKAEDLTD